MVDLFSLTVTSANHAVAYAVWCLDHKEHHIVSNAWYPRPGGIAWVLRHRKEGSLSWSCHNYHSCPCRMVAIEGELGDALVALWSLQGDKALDAPPLGQYG